MQMTAKPGVKSCVMAFLMALFLMFGITGELTSVFSVNAYANAPTTAGTNTTGKTDTTSSSGTNIFDVIGDDGQVVNNGGGFNTDEDSGQSITTIITKYKTIATAIMGILTITMLIFMLIQFTKLGAAGDNEMQRKRAIMGILTTGIATALLGGATVVVGFFWNAVKGTD